jgi:hypothetical protein
MSTVKMSNTELRQYAAWLDKKAPASDDTWARSYLMQGRRIGALVWTNNYPQHGRAALAAFQEARRTLSDLSESIDDIATIVNGGVTQADIDRMINPRLPSMQERIAEAAAELRALRLDAFGEASIGDGSTAPAQAPAATATDQRQRAADMLTQYRASRVSDAAFGTSEGLQIVRAFKANGMQAASAIHTAALLVDAESTVDLSALSDGDVSALLMWLVPQMEATKTESENE